MNGVVTWSVATLFAGVLATPASQAKPLTQHWGQIYAVAFSPDGTRIASASAKHLEVHATSTGKQLSRIGLRHGPRCIAFAPSGNTMVVDTEVIDVSSAQVVQTLDRAAHEGKPNAIAFSPDGKTVAVATQTHAVKLISFRDGQVLHQLQARHRNLITAIAFSHDGQIVATASNGRLELWSARWGRLLGELGTDLKSPKALAFSPTTSTLAAAGGGASVELWNTTSQRRVRTGRTDGSLIGTLAFTSDGKTLVAGGTGAAIQRWSAATLAPHASIFRSGGSGQVTALAIAPNGSFAAVGDSTGGVRLLPIPVR